MSDAALKNAEALLDKGDRLAARSEIAKVLRAKPDEPHALHLMSTIDMDEGRIDEAEKLIQKLLSLDPAHAPATYNLGVCAMQKGDQDAALALFNKALEINPTHSGSLYNVGYIVRERGDRVQAISLFEQLVKNNPNWLSAWEAYADTLLMERRDSDALAAIEMLIRQSKTTPQLYRLRGDALRMLGRFEDAEASYLISLKSDATNPDALHNLAGTFQMTGRLKEAIPLYERVMVIARRVPAFADRFDAALSELIHLKRETADWSNLDLLESQAKERLMSDRATISPLLTVTITDDPALQLKAARSVWPNVETYTPRQPLTSSNRDGDKIRIGYISQDFKEHPVSYLLAGAMEAHDRSRFTTIGYSVGFQQKSETRRRMRNAFRAFRDFINTSDEIMARMLVDDDLDILVDLMGHTRSTRLGVLKYRPAPITVHYLGYPGTLGSSHVDYLIADHVVAPEGHESEFSEAVVRLPDCYQANDNTRPLPLVTRTRDMLGLGKDTFVFGALAQTVKLSPALFSVYMDILKAVPNSVLWLMEDMFSTRASLRAEAKARGVKEDRLVFATRETHEDHLNRLPLADLFLDSWPYGGHTSTSDALWAGVPVITKRGGSFASRVPESILRAAGLPDLVADDERAFVNLATSLANDKARLAGYRKQLENNRQSCALFDTQRFTSHLESAFEMMVERKRKGLAPASFSVPRKD